MRAGSEGQPAGRVVQAIGSQPARRLQIKASRLVTSLFAGEYRSAFRGRGMEFDEVREYQVGDDVRSIDWNVTARQGRPFVKRFVEERELTLLLLLDRSPSMNFGTVRAAKLDTALETCALLAFAAQRSRDRLALMTFGDGPPRYLRPAKGRRQAMRLIGEAMAPAAMGKPIVGLAGALELLGRVTCGRSLVCILSDFLDQLPISLLAAAAARHEIVAVAVSDPAEEELPVAGLLRVADLETGAVHLVDTGSQRVRDRYRDMAASRRAARKAQLLSSGVGFLEVGTQTPPLKPLMQFFLDCRLGQRS